MSARTDQLAIGEAAERTAGGPPTSDARVTVRARMAVLALGALALACTTDDGETVAPPEPIAEPEVDADPPEPDLEPSAEDDGADPLSERGDADERAEPDLSSERGDADERAEPDLSSVELAASWCADLPRSAHPDLDVDDAELAAATACLVWVGVTGDAGYAPVEADVSLEDDQVTEVFDRVAEVVGDADGVAHARGTLDAASQRRDVLVAAARTLVSVGEGTGALDDQPRGGYRSRVRDLPDRLTEGLREHTWQEGCPVHLDRLRLLEVVHVGFDDVERWGQLVVHEDVADDVAEAFRTHHDHGFPIERIEPIERYEGDDDASMAANNTSAFNCRPVTGSNRWSEHSYGWAIDINPVQNPYVRGATVAPEAGRAYLDRDDGRPGMLLRPGAVEAWDAIGWGWGGDWATLTDHQHISLTRR